MARTGSWVMRTTKTGKLRLVARHKAAPRHSGPVRGVISDTMDALIHPCTGKMMDSKSEFRKVTRAKGGTEVGNEKLTDRRELTGMDSRTRRDDIARAITELGG